MNKDSGKNTSVWVGTAGIPDAGASGFSALAQNIGADVCIVGAGIAGLTTAYLLACEGKKVVVLEDGALVSGETARTTAHLASAMDDRFTELERIHGEEGSRLARESHQAAIEKIQTIVLSEQINCDFTRLDGYLFLAAGQTIQELDDELDAAHRAGFLDAEKLHHFQVNSKFNLGACIRFPNQGQFHVLKYLRGLVRAIVNRGGQIFTHTHADVIHGGKEGYVQTDKGFKVTAEHIVVATNTPVNDRVTMHTKQAPYRTYVVTARIPRGSVPPALYWDMADPYHYVRLQPDEDGVHDLLIIGGEDHKTGQEENTDSRFNCLRTWSMERFPEITSFVYEWSGQVMEPVDALGFMGKNPGDDNVYIITGDSGQGMTHTTIGAMIITDLIAGRENPWAALYDPSRVSMSTAGEFLKENLNAFAQYKDLLTGSDVDNVDQISLNSGAVMRRGLKKVAVYKDNSGKLHECSALCPHLGGVVTWNDSEKSWDCPVHGSRFDPYGRVMNGPANSDLEKE